MNDSILTQERLKELLDYNPDTGLFTWLVSTNNRVKVGDIAVANSHGYVLIRIDKRLHKAHRLAFLYMEGAMPEDQVDHIDHSRDNNSWSNLRHTTQAGNNRNATKRKTNTSGFTGVSWNKDSSKWISQVRVDGRQKNLGRYIEIWDAICARKSANLKYGYHENHGI